jgi:long-chain acyl-CoA synthetase
VVLVGQDKRELGALVFPDQEALAAEAVAGAGSSTGVAAAAAAALEQLLYKEVCHHNSQRPDYHPEDHINHIQARSSSGQQQWYTCCCE